MPDSDDLRIERNADTSGLEELRQAGASAEYILGNAARAALDLAEAADA